MPTRLKLLRGNPGKRRLPPDEPRPTPGVPECPTWISGTGRTLWIETVRELGRLGMLTRVDAPTLEGYCASYARAVKAERALKRGGFANKYGQVRAEISIARQAWSEVRRFAAEFGLTPAARTRVSAPARPDAASGATSDEVRFFGS